MSFSRRARHLEKLDSLISFFQWSAKVLGNTTLCLYPFQWGTAHEH
jgi:hypothetical protein